MFTLSRPNDNHRWPADWKIKLFSYLVINSEICCNKLLVSFKSHITSADSCIKHRRGDSRGKNERCITVTNAYLTVNDRLSTSPQVLLNSSCMSPGEQPCRVGVGSCTILQNILINNLHASSLLHLHLSVNPPQCPYLTSILFMFKQPSALLLLIFVTFISIYNKIHLTYAGILQSVHAKMIQINICAYDCNNQGVAEWIKEYIQTLRNCNTLAKPLLF